MRDWSSDSVRALAFVALVIGLGVPIPLRAQMGRGFLLKEPSGSIGLVGGWSAPQAGGELFDETYRLLSVEKADFRTGYVGGEGAIRLNARWDFALALGRAKSEAPSHFLDLVESDGSEITQVTRLTTVPLALGARYYVSDRGRSIGRFAWIPSRVAPFVGAGLGYLWYNYEQSGDFVDFVDSSIYTAKLASSGGTGLVHASAGMEVSLNPLLLLTTEARYAWARADLGETFDHLSAQLGGARLTLGLSARF